MPQIDLFGDPPPGGERPKLPRLLRMGTSSFANADWVGPFYPPGTRPADYLAHYASRFDTVEIDSTYYGVPAPSTVARWRDTVPETFLISAKFPREIVHGGTGRRPDRSVVLSPDATYPVRDDFLNTMSLLGERAGPLVLQFPFFSRRVFPDRGEFIDRLDRFLADLPGHLRVVVEVRNGDWVTSDLAARCRDRGAALALVDQAWMPHGDEVETRVDPVTAGFAYLRLLGDHREIEKITTTWDREVVDRGPRLRRWAEVVARLLDREVPTFVYVNNHYAGHAPATLRRLMNLVREVLDDVPWETGGEDGIRGPRA